jgi:tRNA_anti-like
LIRKLIVAMVAAAMLVAMAVPAFAQNFDPIALALQLANQEQNAALVQACKIEQNQTTNVSQSNEQNQGHNVAVFGTASQSQSAENNATVVPIQNNSGDVKCEAELEQEAEIEQLAIPIAADLNFGGPERNGPGNGPPPPPPPPVE